MITKDFFKNTRNIVSEDPDLLKYISSDDLHPILTLDQFNELLKHGEIFIKDGKKYLCYFPPLINFTNIDGKEELSVLQDLSKTHPIEIEIIQFQHDDFNALNSNSFIRIINESGPKLIIIHDPLIFYGEIYSRSFPLIATLESRAEVEENQLPKTNKIKFYQSIFKDKNYENIRNANVIIIGGGTVGASIADALARLGVRRYILCEKSTETLELHNTVRYMNGGILDYGLQKFSKLMTSIINQNPFANVTFLNKFPSQNDNDSNNLLNDLRKWIENNPSQHTIAYLALDDMEARITAHKFLKELGIPTISPTDLDKDSLTQFDDYSQKNYPSIEDRIGTKNLKDIYSNKLLIKLLGGIIPVITNFSLELIQAVLSDAYDSFPQLYTAAELTGAKVSIDFIRMIQGKTLNTRSYIHLANVNQNPIEAVSDIIKKIQILINVDKKKKTSHP